MTLKEIADALAPGCTMALVVVVVCEPDGIKVDGGVLRGVVPCPESINEPLQAFAEGLHEDFRRRLADLGALEAN